VRGRRLALVTAGVLLGAWCGWVSDLHRSTRAAEVTWLLSLAAVVATDLALSRGRSRARAGWHLEPAADPWPRPGRGGGRRALRGVAPWLALIGVVLAWDLLGLDTGPHSYHLTISALAQAYRPLNAAVLLVWLLVGIGYEAARGRAPTVAIPGSGHPTGADPNGPGPGAVLSAGVLTVGSHHANPGLLLPSSPHLGVAFWVAVPVVALMVDAAARRSAGRVANGEEFIRFISTAKWANTLLIAGWAFAGYHLFAR
jgi:hypothetical protein